VEGTTAVGITVVVVVKQLWKEAMEICDQILPWYDSLGTSATL
jgi:hypothetical protein